MALEVRDLSKRKRVWRGGQERVCVSNIPLLYRIVHFHCLLTIPMERVGGGPAGGDESLSSMGFLDGIFITSYIARVSSPCNVAEGGKFMSLAYFFPAS